MMTQEEKVKLTLASFEYAEEVFNNTSKENLDYLSVLEAFQAGYDAGFKKAQEASSQG